MGESEFVPELEVFGFSEQELIYQSVVHAIRTGYAGLFVNFDRNHPTYITPYNDETKNLYPFGPDFFVNDDPLFSLLWKTSENILRFNENKKWFTPVRTWSDFQKLISGEI